MKKYKFYESAIFPFVSMTSILIACILGCVFLYRWHSIKNDVFYMYRTSKYEVASSYEYDRFYRYEDGEIIELPFLPSGLSLRFELSMDDVPDDGLPYLAYWKHPAYPQNLHSDGDGYTIRKIKSIFINEDSLLAITTENQRTLIDLNNPIERKLLYDSEQIDFNDFSSHYDFVDKKQKIQKHLVDCGFSIQDRRKNKYYHVNYSTSQIEGIVRLGLYENKFYFGETIYAYFILDLDTDEITYFKNKNEYDSFCNENIHKPVQILESRYLHNEKHYL